MKLILIPILMLFLNTIVAQNKNDYPLRKYISNDSLLVLLNNYYVNNSDKINLYFLPEKDSITSKTKSKILSLLKREWPDSIVKMKVEEEARNNFEYDYFLMINQNATEETKTIYLNRFIAIRSKSQFDTTLRFSKEYYRIYDSVYQHIYDSMLLNYKKNKELKIKENIVNDKIVIAAGVIKLKKAIPILKNDIASAGKHFFSKEAAEIALAGLGDTLLQRKYIQQHDEYVKQAITYSGSLRSSGQILWKDFLTLALIIQTQESISKLADWLDTAITYRGGSGDEGEHAPRYFTGAELIPNILWFIKNKSLKDEYIKLPMKPGYDSYYDYYGITAEQMLFVREWLIKNKGKYEFN